MKIMHVGLIAAALLASPAALGEAVIKDPVGMKICRSNSCLKDAAGREVVFQCGDIAACDAMTAEKIREHGLDVTSGSNTWDWRRQFATTYKKPATCTAPSPSTRQAQCEAPNVGSWEQSATQGPAPACDVTWTPATPPAGACVEPASEPTTWQKCADQWASPGVPGTCVFSPSPALVRYGDPLTGRYGTTARLLESPVKCEAASFGGENPAPQTVKVCERQLVVEQGASGEAVLRWAPPTENEDGTPLADLSGYRVLWGTVDNLNSTAVV